MRSRGGGSFRPGPTGSDDLQTPSGLGFNRTNARMIHGLGILFGYRSDVMTESASRNSSA